MSYEREPFKELDIMDNFLFNKLTTKKETKEKFCRLLLRELIGKELGKITIIAESIIPADDSTKRGVRLDVKIDESDINGNITSTFDIEPHRTKESDYPKRTRYRQAQLDKDSMKVGDDDFSHMPDLYIINITNYDPYGYDHMVYTVESRCIEVPDLVYNDGVKIYYFNTEGTKGGSKELKLFLNYLENSKKENVVNKATQEAAEYVDYLKDDKTIEGDYMTVGNWIDRIVKDAVAEKDASLAEKDASLAKKDASLAEKDQEIERLREILKKNNIDDSI